MAHILKKCRRVLMIALPWIALVGKLTTQSWSADLSVQIICGFDGTNGVNPEGRLAMDAAGNFYGTTGSGGTYHQGTVFKISPLGVLTTLVSFSGTNGSEPRSGLVLGQDGNFYGTTTGGGTNGGNGTIFRISPGGILTSLSSFGGANGRYPRNGFVQGRDGNFYGTTVFGGTSNMGVIFKCSTNGAVSVLHSFIGTDGRFPGGLIQGSDDYLYGTTGSGGTNYDGGNFGDWGTVFKMTTNGGFSSLVSFNVNDVNGMYPSAGLAQGSDNNFYGTTSQGGMSGKGTIFRITPTGNLSTLFVFAGTNGSGPAADLLAGSEGFLYGTTSFGGENSFYGVAFRVSTNGQFSVMRSFNTLTDGRAPNSLVEGPDGNVYGTTSEDYSRFFRFVASPRILKIQQMNAGRTITWNSFTNATYRLEYKNTAAQSDWNTFAPSILSSGQTTSFYDNLPSVERYYRVVLLPLRQ